MGALVFCVLEKINGAKWTQCPGFFTRAIVTIGHPDGHNFIRDRAFENTNLYDYRSSEYHRQDELVEKLDSVDGRRDTETGGKKFFQFYLRYKVPLFTLLTVYFQIAAHIYYYTGERCTNRYTGLQCNMNRANAAIRTSPLTMVSRTDLGHEYWRLWTYQFVHAGYEHLLTNSLVLLVLEIPLELVHGPHRLIPIYSTGVVMGALVDLIFTPTRALVGASGGVYTLLTAHLANVVLNFDLMTTVGKIARIVPIVLLIAADIAMVVWRKISDAHDNISNAAHLGGSLVGITLGIFVLKNFHKQQWEERSRVVGFGVFILILVAAVVLALVTIKDPTMFKIA